MHQIKVIALVVVAVFLVSGLGATAISSRAAQTDTKVHAAGSPTNKLVSPPSVQWEKTFASDNAREGIYANSVKQTADGGGYIVAGTAAGNECPDAEHGTCEDVYLLKTDANGNKQWDKRFDAGQVNLGSHYRNDGGSEVQLTSDGGYVVVGTAVIDTRNAPEIQTRFATPFVYVIKTDANGNKEWAHSYNHCNYDHYGHSISQTTDGGYIVAGKTTDFDIGKEFYLFKLTSSGTKQWEGWWSFASKEGGWCEAWSVKQTNDGGYIAAGQYGSGAGQHDLWLMKVSAGGTKQWDKIFKKASDEWHINSAGFSVQQSADGGYVVAGVGNATGGSGGTQEGDTWLIKTDANGNKLWDKLYSPPSRGYAVQLTKDGGYVVAGDTLGQFLVLKTDANGNLQWQKIFRKAGGAGWGDGSWDNPPIGFSQTSDGGYVVVSTKIDWDPTPSQYVANLIKLGPE